MDRACEELTAVQRTAVQFVEGPLLVLAGPGSGKTRVVTHRIAHLLRHGVPGEQILALTFTNKAAEQMQRRLDGLAPGQPVWVGTFHRFCARLLRQYAPLVGLAANFTIYDQDDSLRALKRVLEERAPARHVTAEQVAWAISRAKNELALPDAYRRDSDPAVGQVAAEVYPHYQARLLASVAVDFDDLLLHVATLLRDNPELRSVLDCRYRFILVDEYQDTNRAQYVILRALSHDYPNLAVTGDPDQSIYGWRGANLDNILTFEHDFPGVRVVRLEQNWRSTKRILRVADQLISCNSRRKQKRLVTDNPPGAAVRLVLYGSEIDEARSIAARIAQWLRTGQRRASEIAIFYRINALSRAFEVALREQAIAFQLVHGLAFYQRKEIKDLLAYALLVNNPQDDVAFQRIVNTPARGIGKVTERRLRAHAREHRLTLWQAACRADAVTGISKPMAGRLQRFVQMMERLMQLAADPVEAILGSIIAETSYRDVLDSLPSAPDSDRGANVDELLTDARQFDQEHPDAGQLEVFLERVRLASDTDDWEQVIEKVTLMTMHAAKGLEFPAVFIVALEEGILPHERNRHDPEVLEEERRLLFVGMTRAGAELELSLAAERGFRGTRRRTVPSSFLMELPRAEMELISPQPGAYSPLGPPAAAAVPGGQPPAAPTPPTTAPILLTTAAKLAGQRPLPAGRCSPDEFAQGMTVVHPDYGPGKVVSLSGSGDGRKATVAFAAAGRRHFVLASSPLRPARTAR